MRIWQGSPVVRTATVSLEADVSAQVAFVYTAAMQVEDLDSVQTVATWSARQRGQYGWGRDREIDDGV